MKRQQFIKIGGLYSLGLAILPHLSFSEEIQTYTKAFLIGKSDYTFAGTTFKMHQETYKAFLKMKAAAAKDDLTIEVVSAYRSFERQKQIFEGKYKRYTKAGLQPLGAIKKIIEYSTIPGTSRHHWGTDIDIIDANAIPRPKSVLQPDLFHGKGPFCKLKEWLNDNANNFGFYEVYTDNANRKGFKYEPWHFSYAPASREMLKQYKVLDIKEILKEENIEGAAHFTEDFITQYRKDNVLDINPALLL